MYIHMYIHLLYFKYPVTHLDDSYIWDINFYRLADNDIVLTTYSLVGKEVGTVNVDANAPAKDDEKNLEDKQVMSFIINSSLKTVKKYPVLFKTVKLWWLGKTAEISKEFFVLFLFLGWWCRIWEGRCHLTPHCVGEDHPRWGSQH